jgi:hypothetical protein
MIARATLHNLHEVLNYDPATGEFTWKVRPAYNIPAGSKAGCVNPQNGYYQIRISGKGYKAQRIAWFMVHGEWPPEDVDHIDGDPLNNCMANLRLASRQENCRNRKVVRAGLKGAYLRRRDGWYAAKIRVDRKLIHLGYFPTEQQAHEAYVAAAQTYFGEFARVA